MKISESQLRKIVREAVERIMIQKTDPQDVWDAFYKLNGTHRGEIPVQELADELGVHPEEIDWHGTTLRWIRDRSSKTGGTVSELL